MIQNNTHTPQTYLHVAARRHCACGGMPDTHKVDVKGVSKADKGWHIRVVIIALTHEPIGAPAPASDLVVERDGAGSGVSRTQLNGHERGWKGQCRQVAIVQCRCARVAYAKPSVVTVPPTLT